MFRVQKFRANGAPVADWDAKYASDMTADTDDAYGKQPFVQTMLRHVRPGARILDAGCGTGGLLAFLAHRGFPVAGVETSLVAVDRARQLVPRGEIIEASIEDLPFPAASFDAYVAIGSWEYPPTGPDGAAGEAFRVLKPSGLAFVEVPHANVLRRTTYVPLKKVQGAVRAVTGERPVFAHHLFRIADLHTALARHAFTVLETRPHDLPEPSRHYGLWVDWPFLRAGSRYELNAFGRVLKRVGNAISPWTIATGMFIVARKQ